MVQAVARRHQTAMTAFLRSFYGFSEELGTETAAVIAPPGRSRAHLWPAPSPHPRLQAAGHHTSSETSSLAERVLVSAYAGVCSFFALGFPRDLSGFCASRFGETRTLRPTSAAACEAYAAALRPLTEAGAVDTGIGRSHFADLIEKLRFDYTSAVNTSALQPFSAERQSFPTEAGKIRLYDINFGILREALANPSCIVTEVPLGPRVKVRPPHPDAEFLQYMKRVFLAGGGCYLTAREVARDPAGYPLVSSFFAVAKDDEKDRGITDRRPSNAYELGLPQPRLPHGCLFGQVLLEPWEALRLSKKDLPDFFPNLAVEPAKAARNAVGRAYSPLELVAAGFVVPDQLLSERQLWLGQTTLCMGDRNALAHATAGHEHIARQCGLMTPASALRYGLPTPRGKYCEGIFVDDWVGCFKHRLDDEPAFAASPDGQASSALSQAYTAYLVPEKKAKSVDGAHVMTAWGKRVDGIIGRSGVEPAKLLRIQVHTLRSLLLPRASRKLVEKLCGLWTDCMMDRRVCFSAFDAIYRVLQSWQYGATYRWPAQVIEELLTAVVWGPMMYSDLRARVASTIYATDASLDKGGCCSTVIPEDAAKELWRFADLRGHCVWLEKRERELPFQKSRCLTELDLQLERLIRSCQCKAVFSYPFQLSDHITLQEAKVIKTLLVRLADQTCHRQLRQPIFVDSQASLGAFGKWRSPSTRLNRLLRLTAPHVLGAGLVPGLFWIRSEVNPADDLTRDVALRGADLDGEWIAAIGPRPEQSSFCPAADVAAGEAAASWSLPGSMKTDDKPYTFFSSRADAVRYPVLEATEEVSDISTLLAAMTEDIAEHLRRGPKYGTFSGDEARAAPPTGQERVDDNDCDNLDAAEDPAELCFSRAAAFVPALAADRCATESYKTELLELQPSVYLGPLPGATATCCRPRLSKSQLTKQIAYVRELSQQCSGQHGVSKLWRPRALHLFSGSGALCEKLQAQGWVVESVDVVFGKGFDLARSSSQRYYLRRIRAGFYDYVHCGPPCASFSVARTPPIRSKSFLYGTPGIPPRDLKKIKIGNALCNFSCRALDAMRRLGRPASLEQPRSSWMWSMPGVQRLLSSTAAARVRTDF